MANETTAERLERIKEKKAVDYLLAGTTLLGDWDWLIQQAERARELEDKVGSLVHIIKLKNKEMKELSNFLKKRNIPLKELSPLITVMAHVEFLEKEKEEKEELKQQNKRYREAFKQIKLQILFEGWKDVKTLLEDDYKYLVGQAKVEEQQKEIGRLEKYVETLQDVHFTEMETEKAENAQLRKALEFYADLNNCNKVLMSPFFFQCPVLADEGEKARKALAGEQDDH